MSMARKVRAEPLVLPNWAETTIDRGWSDYAYKAGEHGRDEEGYAAMTGRLLALIAAVDRGHDIDAGVWRSVRGELAIEPLPCCGTRPAVADAQPTKVFARLATDFDPAVDSDAPDALLGSWAAMLDARVALERRALVSAMAAAAFTITPEFDRTAIRAWLHDERRPSRAQRAQALAATRAPYAPWRIHQEADGWRMEPLVPIRAWWTPPPMSLEEAGGVDGGPTDGGLLFARVVPGEEGWQMIAPIVLPVTPPDAWWRAVFLRHASLLQTENRSLRLEDVCRRIGHRMCREAHQWWWVQRSRYRVAGSS